MRPRFFRWQTFYIINSDLCFDQAKIENAAKQLFTTRNEINVVAIMFYLNLMKLAKFAHDSSLWLITVNRGQLGFETAMAKTQTIPRTDNRVFLLLVPNRFGTNKLFSSNLSWPFNSLWFFMNLQEFAWNFILFFLFTTVDSNVKIVVRVGFWRFGVR